MGKYMQITHFFSNLIKKGNYTDDDVNKLIKIMRSCKNPEDLMFIIKLLNNCPYIFEGYERSNKLLYKPYLNMAKSIRFTFEYSILENIPTQIYEYILNKLIQELYLELMVEETSIIVNNIIYIFKIIMKRNDFKALRYNRVTETLDDLKVLIVLILTDSEYPDILFNLYMDIYKDTEYDSYFKDESLDREVYDKVFRKRS